MALLWAADQPEATRGKLSHTLASPLLVAVPFAVPSCDSLRHVFCDPGVLS